ncbi:MAG: 7-cyano-7-deazaguanine synthase QueC [Lachnospiraceae bacterium]|jgi:7-cyano-7-deazaguanine synthase|nr:7-cyano-7-deazaguanine synthase QueC [Lachnospiraceae bacterium]
MKEKAMVLFSGGVDSTTCLGVAIDRFGKENVIPLSIVYGQKHEKEMEAARKVLAYYGLKGMELDLTPIFAESDCSLLSHSGRKIPEGSYASQLEGQGGVPVSTYVPFRNGLFLASAASMALSMKCSYIYYGAHRDDAAGNAYPDCSEAFFDSMNQAVYEGCGKALRIEAPFIHCNKADVVKEGLRLGVPYELTWSCYEGGEYPCGHCGTCIDRQKAFEANGMSDPALLQK